jgi:hypothetical protein
MYLLKTILERMEIFYISVLLLEITVRKTQISILDNNIQMLY